ncbi:MAG: endonuclease NucS [Candidatus Bathyarchaeia archaeon]
MQGELLEDSLVLVGSTRYDYVESLRAFIQNKGFVWSSWNFRIREQWRETILKRIKTKGKFPIFFYMSKKKGGSGLVEYVGSVSEIRMVDIPTKTPDPSFTNPGEEDFPTEDFKSYTWFKFSAVDPVGPFELQIFRDIETEDPVIPSQLKSAFAYAFIAEGYEEVRLEEEPIMPTSISVERDLRKYLVAKLNFLEQGLKLYQDQERTGEEYPIEGGKMRIDILAKDPKDNFVVVELKAGVADVSTFGQISAYIGWVKENLAKNSNARGIIVANDFDDKIKYAVKSNPQIKLKRYKLMFEFEDIKP